MGAKNEEMGAGISERRGESGSPPRNSEDTGRKAGGLESASERPALEKEEEDGTENQGGRRSHASGNGTEV